MKKRTVITTEMQEIWIVRLPSSDPEVLDPRNDKRPFSDSPETVSEANAGADLPPNDHELRGNEGKKK
jgi:hypothetical protein